MQGLELLEGNRGSQPRTQQDREEMGREGGVGRNKYPHLILSVSLVSPFSKGVPGCHVLGVLGPEQGREQIWTERKKISNRAHIQTSSLSSLRLQ